MARLCERPGCSERGAVAYGFDADRLLVWLAPLDPDVDRMRAGVLCTRHADSMVVPMAWTLDDRREVRPPLFRAPRTPRRKRTPRGEPAPRPDVHEMPAADEHGKRQEPPELPLDSVDEQPADDPPERTVAKLSGTRPDDPDATIALPWMPTFDADDDLDGLLHATSPLLGRAFEGSKRRRRPRR